MKCLDQQGLKYLWSLIKANFATDDEVTSKCNAVTSGLTTEINNHTGNTGNPHNVTKAQIGLGNFTYEEGKFTGKLYNNKEDIATESGRYRRVGNMVYVYIAIFNISGKVPVGMTGLPFPHLGDISPNNKSELFYSHSNTLTPLRPSQIAVGNTILFDSEIVSTDGYIEVFGWYRINTNV